MNSVAIESEKSLLGSQPVAQVANVAKVRIDIIVVVQTSSTYISKEGRQVHVITAAKLKFATTYK
jgi:hypothetical protein